METVTSSFDRMEIAEVSCRAADVPLLLFLDTSRHAQDHGLVLDLAVESLHRLRAAKKRARRRKGLRNKKPRSKCNSSSKTSRRMIEKRKVTDISSILASISIR